MKFEEAIQYLEQGYIIAKADNEDYKLQIVKGEVIHTFCIEISDLLGDWVVLEKERHDGVD